MAKTLGLIHTSATLVPVFQALTDKYLADKDLKIFNISDDSLIKNTIERGALTPDTSRRVVDYVTSAEEAGADYILVTCSSIGPAVETAATLTKIPVLRVDQPMADKAVQMGTRIGVVATLPTTLEPTSDLVRRRAVHAGKEIKLTSRLCAGAFDALMGGQPEVHDRMVANALKELAQQVDVILLAQASMARVVGQLAEADKKVPIITSPELAIQHLAEIL
ncbi:aspartate/glutamate racemase family protein [Flavilitoribacter nigricans]|uniref:Asp/Glu/hydantoin racemase n=1 Tax=Flavilitoribacter nigricans (strain ATCC 23147 / DSM 23189 / NBRC 102662 / NCIMB 1420 / SS-2) TaxID=1122177 RepID=A0A2D0N1R3_FLAN2|nr:aspartate/glutamate racemase family protein [Flavilitoribacter nigricans]PHN02471.1 Asp/Glu/hydantoin racemase [Flavilitoribacter nigricans DSM 23189 = NBRC 102662]